MLTVTQYPLNRQTDRDLEIPNIIAFARENKLKYESLLDVGAHYSAGYYANELRLFAKKYHGLDPGFDEAVSRIVDKFHTADFLEWQGEQYDFVLCCSTIEHVGMYPIVYKDREGIRDVFFKKLLATTKKYLWISFPVGQRYEAPGEMSIIPGEQCDRWLDLVKEYKVTSGFFHSEGAQAGFPWELSTKERCYAQPYVESLGTQSVCILEIEK
jgi:hypothetical protein